MKILIISDLHLRHRQMDTVLTWEEPYDLVVYLGDYWDHWHDTVDQNVDAALWIKEKLADPRSILLQGNHEMQYVWPHHEGVWRRQDNQHEIMRGVRSILTDADFAKLRPYYLEPATQILFSHAGIDARLPSYVAPFLGMPFPEETPQGLATWIDELWPSVLVRYRAGREHPLLAEGTSRGGVSQIGGIVWEDLDKHRPVKGCLQVIGHSTRPSPIWRFLNHRGPDSPPVWWRAEVGVIKSGWLAGGATLGMDTSNRFYLVIDTDLRTLTIKSVTWNAAVGGFPESVSPGKVISIVTLPPPAAPVSP